MDYIIVGLGNPGRKYINTRHNAGFIAIDSIAKKYNVEFKKLKFKSIIAETKIENKKVLLLKPDTYMNLSGQAVVEAMNFYNVPPQNVIVILDDVALDFGKVRIRLKGSDGGQNGMKNIIYLSGNDQFPRIKIGVGNKPHPDFELADWVLSEFTQKELDSLKLISENICSAVELMIGDKVDKAMNLYSS